MQHSRIKNVGKAACAAFLSCLLVASPVVDGLAAGSRAFAAEGSPSGAPLSEGQGSATGAGVSADGNPEGADTSSGSDEAGPKEEADPSLGSGQFQQELPLMGGAVEGATGSNALEHAPRLPQTTADDRATGDVALSDDEASAQVGTIVIDGVKYVVNADGETATVAGWHGEKAPEGDLAIVAKVVSGRDSYRVVSIADEAFKGCADLRTVTLPDELESIGKNAFSECPTFETFLVGEHNALFAAFDGMLFDAPLETLVRCPEGKQGVALLPETAKTVGEGAFAGCARLAAINVEAGSESFSAVENILYSKDRTTLLHAPARTVAASIALETKTVAAGSFAECTDLASVLSLGAVETVEGGAFAFETIANAVVALAPGDDYDARKAVWEHAGFSKFKEPADPGTVQKPAPGQGGFAFELLDDYTLAVSWSGQGDPDAYLYVPTSGEVNGVSYRVSAIAPGGFVGIERLTNVQIRAPIAAVGDNAFAGCANLSSLSLEEGVSSIGAGAFAGTAVESVMIPASVSFVGERAFSDCSALSRILAFSNDMQVAADALSGCSGVSMFCPTAFGDSYPWNPGLPVAGNHLYPFGVSFAPEPLVVGVGESADLFEGGACDVPQACELSYSYAATPLSVESGMVTGKKPGISEVSAAVSLDGIELARAARTVEVREAPAAEEPPDAEEPAEETVDEPERDALPVIDEERVLSTAMLSKVPRINKTVALSSANTCTVTFGLEYGSIDGKNESVVVTVSAGEKIAAPASDPVKEGYSFTGWYKDALLTTPWNFESDTVAADTVIYAGWEVSKAAAFYSADKKLCFQPVVHDSESNTYTARVVRNDLGDSAALSGDLVIPATVEDESTGVLYTVTEIGSMLDGEATGVFRGCSELTAVSIPDTVTSIGRYAFRGCSELASASLSSESSLCEVGAYAFRDCTKLSAFTLGSNSCLQTVRANAFGNTALVSFDVPNSVVSIELNAFIDCAHLTSVTFGADSALETLGSGVFSKTGLVSIELPSSVKSIGDLVFMDCPSLTSVTCFSAPTLGTNLFGGSPQATVYLPGGTLDGKTYAQREADWKAAGAPSVAASDYKTVTFDLKHGTINGVADHPVFFYRQGEKVTTIPPDPVKEGFAFTGWYATSKCDVLWDFEQDVVTANTVIHAGFEMLDEATFYQTCNGKELRFLIIDADAARVRVVRNDHDADRALGGDLVIPSTVENSGITYTVTEIGSSVDSGSSSAFQYCENLTSVFIPNTVTSIGVNAFCDCAGLTSVVFEGESTLEILDSGSFARCSLSTVAIPRSVKTLGKNALLDSPLSHVSFESGSLLESIDEYAFGRNKNLSSIVLPNKVKTIANDVFRGCAALTDVRFEEGSALESIGEYAFVGTALEAIVIPKAVKYLDRQVFSDISTLKSVVFETGSALEVIKNGVFARTAITSIDLPDRVSEINNYAFSECTSLASVTCLSAPTLGTALLSARSACTVYLPNFEIGGKSFDQRAAEWKTAGAANVAKSNHKKVTFELRGGLLGESPDSPVVYVAPGQKVPEPTIVPTKEDFVFGGWYKDPPCSQPWDFQNDVVTANASIWSKWDLAPAQTFYKEIDKNELRFQIITEGDAATPGTVRVVRNDHGDYTAISGDLVIPSTVENEGITYVVTEVGNAHDAGTTSAFQYCDYLTSVLIPNTVTLIGINAFMDCDGVTSVEFEEGSVLTTISRGALGGMSGLNAISIPDSVKTIGRDAFANTKLQSISFGRGSQLEFIGQSAFMKTQITSVSLPSFVKTLDIEAFKSCPNLSTVYLPASVESIGANAFAACPQLAVVSVQETADGVDPLAFDATAKANARVCIPDVSTSGKTFEQLKASWGPTGYGFSRIVAASGVLPTKDDPSNNDPAKASWSFADGTLVIEGNDTIADFKWSHDGEARFSEHWSPLRNAVERIVVSDSLAGVDGSMASWFQEMANLVDISGVRVLPGAKDVKNLFLACHALKEVPSEFVLPAEVENVEGLFSMCESLEKVSENFSLPDSSEGHAGVTNAKYLFLSDEKLEGVSFRLPNSLQNAYRMFYGCASLSSLPEGFKIPASIDVANAEGIFSGCASLVRLPDSFDLPDSAITNATIFQVSGERLPLYYGGSNPNVTNYVWEQANRTLVTPGNRPSGAKAITLNVKLAGEAGRGSHWTTVYTDAAGALAEPSYAPARSGMVFTLWYTDEACTQRADFSKAFTGDTTLYGVLAPGTRGGALPTVAGTGSAFWSLTDDGTLFARGAGEVQGLGWHDSPDAKTNLWAPYRSRVTKVVTCPSLRNNNFSFWFYGCFNLTDISGFSMPDNVVNMGSMFQGCSSLRVVPEGFVLPAGVTETYSMFSGSGIVSLPASFTLPDTVTNAAGMFYQCASLASLPEKFKFTNPKVKLFNVMRGCTSLTSLPSGFTFPVDSAVQATEGGAPPFGCDVVTGTPRVATYYAGNDPAVLEFDWAGQNRVLITDPADRNMHEVTYKLVNADGTWSTHSVALTDENGMVPNPGAPQNGSYGFTGWSANEECLESFNFDEPVDQDTVLYGKWIKRGGRDKAINEGQLPMVSDGEAWWQIAIDGTLMILGKGELRDFKWEWNVENTTHWYPYRAEVSRIAMVDTIRMEKMNCWFQRMDNLKDINGVRIPEKTRSIACLFFASSSFKSIPEDFGDRIPDSVTNMNSVFNNCGSVEKIPSSFRLPSSVREALCLFQGVPIVEIPEAFGESIANSKQLVNLERMFNGCTPLQTLPSTFSIPESAVYVSEMFKGCTWLKALPEGFTIPKTSGCSTLDAMFSGCDHLTSFPASFDFPLEVANASTNPFKHNGSSVKKTYFAGGRDSESAVNQYAWDTQNREIVYGDDLGDQVLVDLYQIDASGAPQLLMHQMLAKGSSMDEPVAPGRENSTFLGWYTDQDCTAKASFPLTLTDSTQLYGKYAVTRGPLPTTDGFENASWELTSDGTLKIACTNGATIASLGWDPANASSFREGTWNDRYWGFVRDGVKRIEMAPGVKATDMICWFAEMHNLTDVSGVYVPENVGNINRLFFRCSSLEAIPNGFSLPEGIEDVSDSLSMSGIKGLPSGFVLPNSVLKANFLFSGCPNLESLPSSFVLPSNIQEVQCMFGSCPKLKALPAGFTLPDSVVVAKDMFSRSSSLVSFPAGFRISEGVADVSTFAAYCTSLESLPEGFTIPKNVLDATRMFEGCTSLKSLPDSFSLPGSVQSIKQMFSDCPNLTSLPAKLDLSTLTVEAKATAQSAFALSGGAEKVVTVYAGNDLSKLSPDGTDAAIYWSENFNRALCAMSNKPENVKTVSFVVADPIAGEDKAWMTVAATEGSVSRPADPARYGYVFDGWYTDPSFSAGSKAVFAEDGTMPVGDDLVLFGTYTLVMSYEMPLKAKVKLDATGAITPADVQMRSHTPVPLKVTDVSCAAADAATEIMDPADLQDVAVTVLPEGARRPLLLAAGESGTLSSLSLPAAQPSAPGILNCAIGLDIADASVVKLWRGGWSTDLLTLTYTVAPAA